MTRSPNALPRRMAIRSTSGTIVTGDPGDASSVAFVPYGGIGPPVLGSTGPGKDVWRVHAAVGDGGRELLVVGARRKEAGPTPPGGDPELRLDILARVLGRQFGPEPEAASVAETCRVEQDAAADPRNAVQPVRPSGETPPKMVEIGSVVKQMAIPGRGP